MNVAITGSGGFIGSHLSKRLEMFGHRVAPLRRYLFAQEGVDCLAQALAGCHAVINLAGAPIDRRWTDAYKRELVESRIMTTRKLVEAVNRLHEPPGVMISASAVGYYGSSGGCHGELDAPEADSFLAELCVAWEKEAGLVNSSVRLVLTRFGIVLSPDGGALPEMMRPARFGVTATAGNPDHLFSWVALEDLADALVFIMGRQDISGPVNVTAPGAHHQPGILQGSRGTFPHPSVHPCSGRRSAVADGRSFPGDYRRPVRRSGDADEGRVYVPISGYPHFF